MNLNEYKLAQGIYVRSVYSLLTTESSKKKLKTASELEHIMRKNENKVYVVAGGAFTIFHAGHVDYLEQAKELGDYLIVAANSDESIIANDREHRFMPINQRATLLAGIGCVDYLTFFTEAHLREILHILKHITFCKGGDYSLETINQEERKIVEENGGKVEIVPIRIKTSSTRLVDNIEKYDRRFRK